VERLTRGHLFGGAAALVAGGLRQPDGVRRSAGVTYLAFWGGWTGPDGLVMQGLVRAFNAVSPDVQVRLTLYNWDLIFDRWRAEFAGGIPPDIVGIHATEVAEYAARGMLREIGKQTARVGLRAADYYGPAWRLCEAAGGLYSIPLDIHPLGLYINIAAAERAGLDWRRPPATAREVLTWAARLTDRRRGQWGYAAPAGDVECFRQWYSLLYQFGGRFLNAAGTRCLANSGAGVRAFAFLGDTVLRQRVAMPREGAVDADLISGRVAMYVQGPWYVRGAQQAGLRFVTAAMPRIGSRPAMWANSHVLGVVNTLDERRVDAALRFIAWLDAHALTWSAAGQLPARNAARARLNETALWPYLRPFAQQLPAIVYQPNLLSHTRLFAETLPTPVTSATQAVMLGRVTPAEAAQALREGVDTIIAAPAG